MPQGQEDAVPRSTSFLIGDETTTDGPRMSGRLAALHSKANGESFSLRLLDADRFLPQRDNEPTAIGHQ